MSAQSASTDRPSAGRASTPEQRDNLIALRRVSKSFGPQRVLIDLDLAIERGKCTVIMGRSGTGKSVLLKHIVGLLRPDRGEVWFEDRRIDQLSERELIPVRREVSMVFQLNALFDSMTVGENVAFPRVENARAKLDPADLRRMVARCLDSVGLSGFEHKRPGELSGGEKKRVALARAIALDPPPKVILYDEPTAGLDPQRADAINRLIRRMQEQFFVTSVVVTHDLASARAIADRVLLLWDGRFIADGPPSTLDQYTEPHVQRFLRGQAEPEDIRA